MVKITIDGKEVTASPESTILEAATKAGFRIPTLCHLRGINEVGACRVCVVEIEGVEKLVTSCNTTVRDGMSVLTASPRVREARRTMVELLLSEHDCNCPTCPRNGKCELQSLAQKLGVRTQKYRFSSPQGEPDTSSPSIVKDPRKCILCYRCVSVCDRVQSMDVWTIAGTAGHTQIVPEGGAPLARTACTYCGQCVVSCPVGALSEKDDRDVAWELLNSRKQGKRIVTEVAPAVRTAWGESLGLPRSVATPGRLVAALKHIGFDLVFDTCFAADVTVMEEAAELLNRVGLVESRRLHGGSSVRRMPMFTSCCPAWVRFLGAEYPEFIPCLSSAKSPQQMFGALAKTYWAQSTGIGAGDIKVLSLMPCTSKKYEASLDVMNSSGFRDVDVTLTTREISSLIMEEGVRVENLPEMDFDAPLGLASGAGVIFGSTGGVMEAALRTAYYLATGKNPPVDAFRVVRGTKGRREAQFDVAGKSLRVAVVHGLGNARALLEDIKANRVAYDFVEVMACPGGCAGGGGQPYVEGFEYNSEAGARAQTLYGLDDKASVRFAHENPAVMELYDKFLKVPGGELSEKLLHTDHRSWGIQARSRRVMAAAAT